MTEERTLGRFRLLRQLGAGGLASVHLAKVEGTAGFQREVAVKFLHPHLKKSRILVELFLQEARTTSTLHHPNIAQVYEVGTEDDQLFMVLEYIEGLDLRQLLEKLSARGETMGTELALSIAFDVTKALQHAHAVLPSRARRHPPVIHRDLSPGNVMVSVDGAVKLLDFGVAKTLVGDAAADQVARGKWPYMSPEQVRGEPLDGRSDLFSLGSLLYELLTGKQAFAGRTVVDSMRRVERADPPPTPGIESGVRAILDRLLSRERDERFPDAGAALAAIGKLLLLRGYSTADRSLAELLDRLAEPEDDGFLEDEDTGVLPPRVVARMLHQETAPRPRAPALPISATPLPSSLSPLGPEKRSAAAGDKVEAFTLPPLGPERMLQQTSASLPGEPMDDVLDEPTVVSFGGPQDQELRTVLSVEQADAFGELPRLEPLPGAAPQQQAPTPQQPVATPWTLPPQQQDATPWAQPLQSSVPDASADVPMAPPEPPRRKGSSRNLLVLTLAILTVLVAGLAIYIAVKQRKQPRPGDSSPPKQMTNASPPPARDASPGKTPDASPLRAQPPRELARRPGSADAGPGRPALADAGAPLPVIPDAGQGRPGAPDGTAPPGRQGSTSPPQGRQPQGAPRRGELDLQSQPAGAHVLVDGQLMGKTPLRVDLTPGKKVQVALSLVGRAVYRTPLWMPPGSGRRLDVILPFIPKPVFVAKPGRTALRILCEGEGPNRVYLDAMDSGFDCPTPPLAVLPVAHSVSVYFSRTQNTRWKQFRPKAGRVNDLLIKE